MRRMRMRGGIACPNSRRLIMKSNHLTMLMAALSLSVSPLATVPVTLPR